MSRRREYPLIEELQHNRDEQRCNSKDEERERDRPFDEDKDVALALYQRTTNVALEHRTENEAEDQRHGGVLELDQHHAGNTGDHGD